MTVDVHATIEVIDLGVNRCGSLGPNAESADSDLGATCDYSHLRQHL